MNHLCPTRCSQDINVSPFCHLYPIPLISIVHTRTGCHCPPGLEHRPKGTASLLLSPHSRKSYCCSVLPVAQTPVSGMRPLMCICLLTLLHFKVVPSRGRVNCTACVKPLFFQGKLRYPFTYYQYLSPPCSTSISEYTRGGTIYYKGKLTGLTRS
jgi:hypothetical protein